MKLWTLLAALAWGQAPPSDEARPAWAGIPLHQTDALGLGSPTPERVVPGFRAPLPSGFVRVLILPDAATARRAFEGERATAATRSLPDGPSIGDAAAGDGRGMLLVLDRNAVILVRDHDGEALQVAERLRAALVVDGCEGVHAEEGGRVWDRCGVLQGWEAPE